VFKYGISGGRITGGGLSARAEAQVRQLNSAAKGQFTYESSIVEMIPGGAGARSAVLTAEKWLVDQYRLLTGAKPPGNIRP
jgi:URI fold toxin 2